MLNRLKKNISILLVGLVGALFVVGLLIFDWKNYQTNLDVLKADVRAEIREVGWSEFYAGARVPELDGMEYCVLKVEQDGSISVVDNHYPGRSEASILARGDEIARKRGASRKEIFGTYLVHVSKKLGKHIILISAVPALKASLPGFAGSIVVGIAGILVLIICARMLSRWLVRPVEDMIRTEKKFMSNASHELKTPLTVIGANTELLAQETGDNKHLQYIRQETERMTVLVNKMLTLVRLDTPALGQSHQKFRVDEAFLDVIYPMESVAYEKHIMMQIDVREDMQITGDEEQIKSLISILLDNAICYTPENGRISISADIHARKLCLRVANTGEAIPEEAQSKLFERFYRQDEARSANDNHFGLGLSIASSIVYNHHGTIQVESVNGVNSFTVVLPVGAKL